MKQTSEEQLQARLMDPEQRRGAFDEVVRQYSEQLYWRVRHIVLQHDDADDVLQNTFIKAWRSLDDFEGKSRISTWLYRIAVNESLDFLRRQKARHDAAGFDVETYGSRLAADSYFDSDEATARIEQAIDMLPDVQRTVFSMRYYDNMKYSEMSEILHTSEGALKASYHHAAKKIVDFLGLAH